MMWASDIFSVFRLTREVVKDGRIFFGQIYGLEIFLPPQEHYRSQFEEP